MKKANPHLIRRLLATALCLPLAATATIDLTPTAFWQHGVNATGDSLTIGAAGTLQISGEFIDAIDRQDSHGGSDIFVSSFSTQGEHLWTRILGSDDNDHLGATTTDTAGNLYLTGTTAGSLAGEPAGSFDVLLARLDSDGSIQWLRQFGSEQYETGEALATDSAGNLYLAGRTAGQLGEEPAQGGYDIFIASFTADGEIRWLHQLGSPQSDYATALAVVGNTVYFAGHSRGGLDGGSSRGKADIVLGAFSTDGEPLWTKQFGTPRPDYAVALAVADDGDLLLTSYSYGDLAGLTNRGDADVFISRFDPSGALRWTRQLGSEAADRPRAMTIGANGNIYVTGYTHGQLGGNEPAGNYDAFVAAWSPAGELLGVSQFGGRGFTQANAVAATPAGALFVLGSTATDLDDDPATGEGRIFLGRIGPSPAASGSIDTWAPTLILRRDGGGFSGHAGDSEDIDLNGQLSAREDLNANGLIDYRSEDRNGNGLLETAEDSDGDGRLSSDSGLASVTLAPGAENLALEVEPFSPGALATTLRITRIDPEAPARGQLIVRDRFGNETIRDIDLAIGYCASAIDRIEIENSGSVHVPQWASSPRDADNTVPGDTLWITRTDNPALFDVLPHVSYPSWSLDYSLKPGASGSATVWYEVVDYATGGQLYYCGEESFRITALPETPPAPEPTPSPQPIQVVSGVPIAIDLLTRAGLSGEISAVSQPFHGSLSREGNTATYQSLPGYSGPDAFSYWVRGDDGRETAKRLPLVVLPGGDSAERPIISVKGDNDQRRFTAYGGGGWGWALLLAAGGWLRRRQ